MCFVDALEIQKGRKCDMGEVIKEYGGMLLAAVGTFLLLGILGYMFFAEDGLAAQMISAWENGGC